MSSPHTQLVYASGLTTLAVIGTAAFVGWLIASLARHLYRTRKPPVIRKPPWKDPRSAQHRNYSVGRDWK